MESGEGTKKSTTVKKQHSKHSNNEIKKEEEGKTHKKSESNINDNSNSKETRKKSNGEVGERKRERKKSVLKAEEANSNDSSRKSEFKAKKPREHIRDKGDDEANEKVIEQETKKEKKIKKTPSEKTIETTPLKERKKRDKNGERQNTSENNDIKDSSKSKNKHKKEDNNENNNDNGNESDNEVTIKKRKKKSENENVSVDVSQVKHEKSKKSPKKTGSKTDRGRIETTEKNISEKLLVKEKKSEREPKSAKESKTDKGKSTKESKSGDITPHNEEKSEKERGKESKSGRSKLKDPRESRVEKESKLARESKVESPKIEKKESKKEVKIAGEKREKNTKSVRMDAKIEKEDSKKELKRKTSKVKVETNPPQTNSKPSVGFSSNLDVTNSPKKVRLVEIAIANETRKRYRNSTHHADHLLKRPPSEIPQNAPIIIIEQLPKPRNSVMFAAPPLSHLKDPNAPSTDTLPSTNDNNNNNIIIDSNDKENVKNESPLRNSASPYVNSFLTIKSPNNNSNQVVHTELKMKKAPTFLRTNQMNSRASRLLRVVTATKSYVSNDENELSVEEGDLIALRGQPEYGWCEGQLDDKIGWFPVEICEELHEFIMEFSEVVNAINNLDANNVKRESGVDNSSIIDHKVVISSNLEKNLQYRPHVKELQYKNILPEIDINNRSSMLHTQMQRKLKVDALSKHISGRRTVNFSQIDLQLWNIPSSNSTLDFTENSSMSDIDDDESDSKDTESPSSSDNIVLADRSPLIKSSENNTKTNDESDNSSDDTSTKEENHRKNKKKKNSEDKKNEVVNSGNIIIIDSDLEEKACELFASNPKKGLNMLIEAGVIENTPPAIGYYLFHSKKLSKEMIGDYIGGPEEFCNQVLDCFLDHLNFKGLEFDVALRRFLLTFKLPGEAQKIDRIVEGFAKKYYSQYSGNLFAHADTVYILSFSLIMLNTDMHSPCIKKKMTKDEFVRNQREINDGKDLPRVFLEDLYQRINDEKILMEDNLFPYALKRGFLLKEKFGIAKEKYQKFWSVLDPHTDGLYFFKNESDTKPFQVLHLNKLKVSRKAIKQDKKRKLFPLLLLYQEDNGKTLEVKLLTTSQRMWVDWLTCLGEALSKYSS